GGVLVALQTEEKVPDRSGVPAQGEGARQIAVTGHRLRVQDALDPGGDFGCCEKAGELRGSLLAEVGGKLRIEQQERQLQAVGLGGRELEASGGLRDVHALEDLEIRHVAEQEGDVLAAARDHLVGAVGVQRGQPLPVDQENDPGLSRNERLHQTFSKATPIAASFSRRALTWTCRVFLGSDRRITRSQVRIDREPQMWTSTKRSSSGV